MNGMAELIAGYDLVIFDLDGVLFAGDQPIPGASAAVTKLRGRPADVVFATNNASRSAAAVAELLESLGIPAASTDVLTSAGAAAGVLATRYKPGSPILVVGSSALVDEVRKVGLRPVTGAADAPVAVVQGYGPNVGWAALAEATVAIRAGAEWIATNADRTLPSPRGPLPGNGSLVAALATALDRQPDVVVGKPDPILFHQAAAATGATRPLVVGDRLDTDIEGANRSGLDSLLVLTGVNRPGDLLRAPVHRRSTYVAEFLDGLFDAARPIVGPDTDGWRVHGDGGALVLAGEGSAMAALRALCAYQWKLSDAGVDAVQVRGVGAQALAVISELML